jgi:uncharacterized protein (TIGR02453 family)
MVRSSAIFTPKAVAFLRQLARNNRREWFQPRKQTYEDELRQPMMRLADLLNEQLRTFAADHVTDPSKAVFRIYRDTRFARDKTPYKTHVAALFPRRGLPKLAGGAYYVQLSVEGVEVAGGIYGPGPAELAAVRNAIVRAPRQFRQLVEAPSVRRLVGPLVGDKLTRIPRAFDDATDDPAVLELLRQKQFYYDVDLPLEVAYTPGLAREVGKRFRAMAPTIDFINAAVLAMLGNTDEPRPPRRPEPMF